MIVIKTVLSKWIIDKPRKKYLCLPHNSNHHISMYFDSWENYSNFEEHEEYIVIDRVRDNKRFVSYKERVDLIGKVSP